MADERIVLPSIAEIEASADILSDPSRSVKVVRVRERFAVKLGTSIAPLEAENMKFVAANIKVPVPKVHDHFVDPETQKRYIVMDYVPRTDLQKLAPSLPEDQKKTVSKRIRDALDELRRIPSQGYFGNLNRASYYDGILSTIDHDPSISGPFENEEQLNQGLLKCIGQSESPHYGHKTVFTHADLQPKNVMVEQKGVCEDGSPDYQVTLIDWNLAGNPEWLELVPDIFDEYPVEYLMMRVFYASMFY
ncbi:kinase-like protein [Aspergillus parasiticus]|uniref:Kinase-like protein n=1 Tax=Aspergillus parasiticus TaxID=5067 RepID=A0A5N6DVN6_ASPPA|nr:kinase-like protein [Aspergillus parasiticus]